MIELAQRSFARGEISPDLWPRTDLGSFATGLRTCRNFIVKKTGGVQNRPGAEYITQVAFGNSGKIRLIPFIFSQSQAYVLEFGNQYVRFYRNSQPVRTIPSFKVNVTAISINAASTITLASTLAAVWFLTLKINTDLNPTWASLDGQAFNITSLISGSNYHWTNLFGGNVNTAGFAAFQAGTPDNPGAVCLFSQSRNSVSNAAQAVLTMETGFPFALSPNQDIYLNGVRDTRGKIIQQSIGDFVLGAQISLVAPFSYYLMTRQGLHVDSSQWPAITPVLENNTLVPYQISSPYLTADLATLTMPPNMADTMFIVHENYPPYQLKRFADDDWTLSLLQIGSSVPVVTAPSVSATTYGNGSFSDPGTMNGGWLCNWFVTAVNALGVESLVSTTLHVPAENGSAMFLTQAVLSWTAPATGGPYTYRIYRYNGHTITGTTDGILPLPAPPGALGLVGTSTTTTYTDNGTSSIDPTQLPLTSNVNPFGVPGSYPNCATFYQNRLMLANPIKAPQTVWGSQVGDFQNFDVSTPLLSTDSFNFTLTSNQLMNINYMLHLNPGFLLLFTENGEWAAFGDSSGTLGPGNYNTRQQSYYGIAPGLKVIPIGKCALYVQASQTVVRDLSAAFVVNGLNNVGYDGDELTLFSRHLLENHAVVDWDYQQIPDSVVWMVRDDGALLGMTFVKEQQVLGWHRHDTLGSFENVCVIPEGNENAVYVTVNRATSNGNFRFVERLASRQLAVPVKQGNGLFDFGGVVDSIFVDAAVTFDGRYQGTSVSMTLSGGTNWTYQERLNLQQNISQIPFSPSMVGDAIVLLAADGSLVTCKIVAFVDVENVTVQAEYQSTSGGVPADLRNTPTFKWAWATRTIGGLNQLEGQQVSVLGDGYVDSSPNEWRYAPDGVTKVYSAGTPLVVTNGTLTLPKPRVVVHVGLPFISDMETLSYDTAQGPSMVSKKKLVGSVDAWVRESRGFWAGAKVPDPYESGSTPLGTEQNKLYEVKMRYKENYQNPIELATRPILTNLAGGQWGLEARGCIRQLAPLPLTVTGIFPDIIMPQTGG